jgi:GMP reductase
VADIAATFANSDVQIIADGGIRKYGDIAKSIAFGADMVMIGGMFAGHTESPGSVLEVDGEFKKAFFGSASEHQKGEQKHVEGKKMLVPFKGSLDTTLQIIKENLQSSVSYAGGTKLSDLEQVEYVLLRK